MKKHTRTIAIMTVLYLINYCANATVLTVSNNDVEVGQFSSISDAHNAANAGDTIYLSPSLKSYAGNDITKKIVILGTGFIKANSQSGYTKITGTIRFQSGSEGSTISSLTGDFNIEVNANNITIQRNKLKTMIVSDNVKNTFIINNIIQNSDCSNNLVTLKSNSYTFLYNNIIIGCQAGFWYYSSTDFPVNNVCILALSNASTLINNNLIIGSKSIFGYENSEIYFHNNIISCSYYGGYDSHVYPFVINGTADNRSTIFIQNENLSNHFTDPSNLNYHLKAGSTAINAGVDGTDSGIYGSEFPFIDDGAPGIPTIYFLDGPMTGSQKDGINITIKAKTNQ